MSVDIRLLGPLVVTAGDQQIEVPASKQRVVLAALALNTQRVVSVDRLAHFIWEDRLPASADATVRTYVMRLRHALGAACGGRIVTRAPGYLMSLSDTETDIGRFKSLRLQAARAVEKDDHDAAVRMLTEALALWRHEPLLDVPSSALRTAQVQHLQELRLLTLGWRIDLDLVLGRHSEILPELWQIVRERPLDEAFTARLMRGLFRAGRQSEALEVFQQTRARLIDQLGTEPGADLQETHRRILLAEDEVPEAPRASTAVRGPAPAQLPHATENFTGRTAELQRLSRIGAPGSPTVTALTGPDGVGKTSLSLTAAHRLRESFPDGQLFAVLTTVDGRALTRNEVITPFLLSLGVPVAELPAETGQKEALFRSLIVDRRMLLVLDDVQHVTQIRGLIPGAGESRLIVTTRSRLPELQCAQHLEVRPLPADEAARMLSAIAGSERTAAEPEATRAVVAACGGLPLALRIAGIRLAQRPHWRVEDLRVRLADPSRIVTELEIGTLSVRRVLDRQYGKVRDRLVRSLSLPTVWRTVATTAAASGGAGVAEVADRLGCNYADAEDALDALAEAHLVAGRPYALTQIHRGYLAAGLHLTFDAPVRGCT